MKIVALKYGESVFGENFIFRGGRSDVLLPISFVIYLIQENGRNIRRPRSIFRRAFGSICFRRLSRCPMG